MLSIVIRQISLRKGKRVEYTQQHTKHAVAISQGQPQDNSNVIKCLKQSMLHSVHVSLRLCNHRMKFYVIL